MEQIIHEIGDKELRFALIRKIIQNLEGKSSLVSKESLEDFRSVIDKIIRDEGM